MLVLPRPLYLQIVAQALDEAPLECCGLLAGATGSDVAQRYTPCRNAAASSRVYEVDPRDFLRADRDAEDRGLQILGPVHSHTHTEAYPSPTDQAMALPWWTYVIVSLRLDVPMLRAFRMAGDGVVEVAVELVDD